jgi:glucose-1-phosphatase
MAEKIKKPIKAIIFDMGGVLLRTCDESPRIQLAEKMGVTVEQLKHEVFSSRSAIQSEEGLLDKAAHWKNVLESFGLIANGSLESFDEMFWAGDCVDQDLLAYIRQLRIIFSLGFISNAFQGARPWIESHYGFMDVFNYTVFSYEVKMRKPQPEIYLLVCMHLGVAPEEAVFVDDMQVNVDGARNAGLHAIHYQDKNQLEKELGELILRINEIREPGNQ